MDKVKKIYSIGQVNALVKEALDNNLPSRFLVTGQITNWCVARSGHVYFDLKDEEAILPCIMWKSRFCKTKFTPEDGMAVLASGFVDVYVPQGRYRFMVGKLEPAGVGALQVAFEQMIERLASQGLFDDAHKKPLPPYPQRIGIVTSEQGAAVHDIVDSVNSRWRCAKLFLYPVAVQGAGSAAEIAAAIKNVNDRNEDLKLDILIVGRGGGSMEDLWAFNEEVVCKAIYDSKIPIISAVGHEVDITIADLVADARASTPTKAGITAVPDMQEVLGQLSYFEKSLTSKAKWIMELCEESLSTILASSVFKNPRMPVFAAEQQLDELDDRLVDAIETMLIDARDVLYEGYEQVIKIEPHRLIASKTIDLNDLKNRIGSAMQAILNQYKIKLAGQDNRLGGLNPKSILKRGYSITTDKKTGKLIKSPKDVEAGTLLRTELAGDNFIESQVTEK